MDLSGSIIVQTPAVPQGGLRFGQVFQGRVSAIDPDGKAVIDFKSFQMAVKSSELQPGDLVTGRLEKNAEGSVIHISRLENEGTECHYSS